MSQNYGINYMGSKNTIAEDIVNYITIRHPDKTLFVDAFCGGLAISHCVLKNTKMEIYANDLNDNMIAFYIRAFNDPTFILRLKTRWVTRDKYLDIQNHPEKYEPWVVGYTLSTWSFGGRGDSYLYAADKEDEKHALFDAIVNNVWSEGLNELVAKLPEAVKGTEITINKRKLILSYYQRMKDDKMQLENLSRFERIESLTGDMYDTGQITFTSMDYKKFILSFTTEQLKNCIIYLDPPYENTTEYAVNSIDYEEFWDFVRSLKDTCPVYVSSYTAPNDIEDVWDKQKLVNFNSNTQNGTIAIIRPKKTEHLFYNGYAEKALALADLLK